MRVTPEFPSYFDNFECKKVKSNPFCMYDEIDTKRQKLTVKDLQAPFVRPTPGTPLRSSYDEIETLALFLAMHAIMREKPDLFYWEVLQSDYSKKVFYDYNYEYFENDANFDFQPASYIGC